MNNKDFLKYIGNESQIYGVEEVKLVGGKGNGMRLFQVRNGSGLEITVSADRCADLTRVIFKGYNLSYFSPCGYVAPQFYDKEGLNFLRSFTAGFMTTCGLTNAGNPCIDGGEQLYLHGTVSNIPCENIGYWICNGEIHIKATVRDASIFSHQLILEREYTVPLFKNEIHLIDRIKNIGSKETPVQMLYHCNMGYPLLNENTVLKTSAENIVPRNEHAKEGIEHCLEMEIPQNNYEEKCYYHQMPESAYVSVYNPDIDKKVTLSYDGESLPYFTEWKMMGEHDYVLGIEPGNCHPDGRDVMRKQGRLEFLKPGETRTFELKFDFE